MLGTSALLAGLKSLHAFGAQGEPQALADLSASEAVARMRRGELSAEQYAAALLERCKAHAALNAFITLEPEQVLRDARAADRLHASGAPLGRLHGLPIPIKDCINTKDYVTTAGTPALRRFRPAQDAPLVARLRAAGALILGKTNLHELSYGWTSNNHAYGAVHNPHDPARIPGGSSGGTAAAVAARMAPLGVAADTEGSIRVPAALCGLVGFRPTTGRYPMAGVAPITPLFDQAGPVARTIDDVALFDSALTAEAAPLRIARPAELRIALCRSYFFDGVDPEAARLAEQALARLKAAGVIFVDAELPGLGELIGRITNQVQFHDTRPALARYLKEFHAGVSFEQLAAQSSDDIRETFGQYVLPGGRDAVTDAAYRQIIEHDLPRLRALYREMFERTRASAIAFPTTMTTAPRIGDETLLKVAGRDVTFEQAMSRNIAPASTAGLPGLVMPVGLANGLPVSVEFDAPAGSDRALLELGAFVESVLGREAPPRA